MTKVLNFLRGNSVSPNEQVFTADAFSVISVFVFSAVVHFVLVVVPDEGSSTQRSTFCKLYFVKPAYTL